MGALDAALDILAAADPTALPASALAAELVALRAQIERAEAQWLRRVAAFDARGAAAATGHASTSAWLRTATRVGPGAAAAAVRTARALDRRLPLTAAALAAGQIGYAHARTLAHHTEALPEQVLAEAEPLLVEAARRHQPHATARLAAHLRAVVDPVGAETAVEAGRDRQRLHLSPTLDGMVAVDGLLDPETGALALAALIPLSARRGPQDTRGPAQRRADALAELSRHFLDTADTPTLAGERPHLTITVDLTTLTAGAPPPPGPGVLPRHPRELPGPPTVDWLHAPLTGETARRYACDAAVVRVLTSGPSEPLDVGRSTRTIPSALRRALHVRDQGCIGQGCDIPPAWTDAHHVIHWADGGPTSLDNLALLCRRHHRLVHHSGWQIERDTTNGLIARPPPHALAA